MTQIQIEHAMEIACDEICKYPEQYDDYDTMIKKHCDRCPLSEYLDTTLEGQE